MVADGAMVELAVGVIVALGASDGVGDGPGVEVLVDSGVEVLVGVGVGGGTYQNVSVVHSGPFSTPP